MTNTVVPEETWRVDADEERLQFDIFSDKTDRLIAMVEESDDPIEDEEHAHLIANAPLMKSNIRKAIRLLADGEDQEAKKLLVATLRKVEPVQSRHGRADNGSAAQGKTGGASR